MDLTNWIPVKLSKIKLPNVTTSSLIAYVLLFTAGTYQLISLQDKQFGDTYRYWNLERGFNQIWFFPEHLGAFFPAFLFAFAPTVRVIAFINFFIWLLTGFASIYIIQRVPITNLKKQLFTLFAVLTWTSSLMLLWNNTGLADSVGLSLIGVTIVLFVNLFITPANNKLIVLTFFCLLLLAITKPAWVILFVPLIVLYLFTSNEFAKRIYLILGFSATIVFSFFLVFWGIKQQYVLGLTYEGWWSFTRAAHLGQVPGLKEISEGTITNCQQISALFDQLRASQTWDGMTTRYPEVLQSCTGIIEYLNQNHNSVIKIALGEPVPFVLTAFDNLLNMTVPGTQYMGYFPNNFFPMNLFAPIFGSGLLFFIFFSGVFILTRYELRLKILFLLVVFSTFSLQGIMVLTDGLEPVRHSVPFALFAVFSVGIILILGNDLVFRRNILTSAEKQ